MTCRFLEESIFLDGLGNDREYERFEISTALDEGGARPWHGRPMDTIRLVDSAGRAIANPASDNIRRLSPIVLASSGTELEEWKLFT